MNAFHYLTFDIFNGITAGQLLRNLNDDGEGFSCENIALLFEKCLSSYLYSIVSKINEKRVLLPLFCLTPQIINELLEGREVVLSSGAKISQSHPIIKTPPNCF
ncbi:hypothetical protein A2996_00795 [Candidatus Campbellbacteria bacterium RIFCSPLOWO2_01_FULL_34_15]|uniref:Uncharacterized protein n=2 Tax=Candidatus Campbelliibacteriota TaxID=1752727 RepID=A0A1F5ENE0_9BACT|nr:MAG: hypothetical protein A2996_00795 [Candidatus Campbellbacteria bacterium RIFCSPLOWO2_01_FULL_34_15]OGD69180.1 MAG: hypothetical protein A2811_02590 [Candidatus Campbellbacteria bacterium RIFCSPHIGHO2_01_FULL_34_10]